jgi:hypothetical protein
MASGRQLADSRPADRALVLRRCLTLHLGHRVGTPTESQVGCQAPDRHRISFSIGARSVCSRSGQVPKSACCWAAEAEAVESGPVRDPVEVGGECSLCDLFWPGCLDGVSGAVKSVGLKGEHPDSNPRPETFSKRPGHKAPKNVLTSNAEVFKRRGLRGAVSNDSHFGL